MRHTGAADGRCPAFLEEQILYMKEQRHRFLCAVCALALVLTAVLAPAAWAAEGTDEAQAEAKTTLTAADAAQM